MHIVRSFNNIQIILALFGWVVIMNRVFHCMTMVKHHWNESNSNENHTVQFTEIYHLRSIHCYYLIELYIYIRPQNTLPDWYHFHNFVPRIFERCLLPRKRSMQKSIAFGWNNEMMFSLFHLFFFLCNKMFKLSLIYSMKHEIHNMQVDELQGSLWTLRWTIYFWKCLNIWLALMCKIPTDISVECRQMLFLHWFRN